MQKKVFKITQEDAGIRLDKYLADKLSDCVSRSEIRKMIDAGAIIIKGAQIKPRYIIKADEEVYVSIEAKDEQVLLAEDIKLDVVYQDDYLVVVNKPVGLTVHPPSFGVEHTMVNALLFHIDKLSDIAGPLKPGIVHRLDKDTSGLMVIAKDNNTHEKLALQFKERTVLREYIAVVMGVVEFDQGVIDAPIGRSLNMRLKRVIDYNSDRDAITNYNVIKRYKKKTVLKLSLKTGRTHQIRVHLKHINHPIMGDRSYGVGGDASRQMLHAIRLGFNHPAFDDFRIFEAKMPEEMHVYIESL
ncbi:MAG: RluA family pseudouridine synthase [Candidatus Kappaea frigidicola]|nr:RluA family pseudouridine synthase [Candidatus Kappaea frigidicola]